MQRTTRDHFTAIADEHHRSLADSVLAAQKAATMYATERDKRVTVLRRDLERVDALTKRARAIETTPARPDPAKSAGAPTPPPAAVGRPERTVGTAQA